LSQDLHHILTAANLAVIGETGIANSILNDNGGLNSTIFLNIGQMNVTRPDQNPDLYDLRAVVTHEIDEVLGIGGNGSSLYLEGGYTNQASPSDGVGPLDFFRYGAPGAISFTLNPAATAYFSIDGGKTTNVYFNQLGWSCDADGTNCGSADFGDWGNVNSPGNGNTPPQIQDAFGSPGATPNLKANELIALDVVGYTLIVGAPTVQDVTQAANSFAFAWTSMPGQSYQVQSTTNLNGNFWNDLGGPITASSLTTGISDTNASGSERFYRVVALSQSAAPAISISRPQTIATPYTLVTNAVATHRFLRARP